MCGRESPPITTLDGGPEDREIEVVWGANMGVDRRALELAGLFDAGVPYGFDEDMWERRLRARGRPRDVRRARRARAPPRPRDARLRPLLHESYPRGRNLRAVHRAPRAGSPRRARAARAGGVRYHIFSPPLRQRHAADGALGRSRPAHAGARVSGARRRAPAVGAQRDGHRAAGAHARAAARRRRRSGAVGAPRPSSPRPSGARRRTRERARARRVRGRSRARDGAHLRARCPAARAPPHSLSALSTIRPRR